MTEKPAIRILALDDEPFMLKLLGCMLTNLGFTEVVACDNGHAALERVDRPDGSPNLILLDLNMPEMDGVEFVRRLAEHHYKGSLILVSGEDERMLETTVKLVRAYEIPVLGHLHKPVLPERLKALIDKWAPRQERAPRPEGKDYSADEVRSAIANGELLNYYQPKVEIATGRVVGVEALVRWQHPVDGMVFPGRFIGVLAPCWAAFSALVEGMNGVQIGPGATQLTRTLRWTRPCASDLVRAWMAPLVAA